MTVLIKRYSNRKLYDTNRKKYINLDGIAELIRDGYEVKVVDHLSGDDLTGLTLSQVVFELERKKPGVVPGKILTELIQLEYNAIQLIRKAIFHREDDVNNGLDEAEIRATLGQDIISRDDYNQLVNKIDELTEKVEKLLKQEPDKSP